MEKVTLYKNHINGIGTWSIALYDMNSDFMLKIQHCQVIGGSTIEHKEVIKEGKQSRTKYEQAVHRAQSRINKQLDKGYVYSIEEARNAPTNALNLLQPMLAQPIKRVKAFSGTPLVQPKFDGHRCLITKVDDQVVAYSRQGKIIDSINHITGPLTYILDEGETIDGELYHHGTALQTIASWVKRKQENTEKLKFHIYDVVTQDPFYDRFDRVSNFIEIPNIVVTPTYRLDDHSPSYYLDKFKEQEYEGAIIRHSLKGYEAGRRSSSLVKVKAFEDSEFYVLDVIPSRDDWGILVCKILGTNNTFRVSAPGTHGEKKYILDNKEQFIGRMVTVEYANLTKDGIPFHPVALRFREDV